MAAIDLHGVKATVAGALVARGDDGMLVVTPYGSGIEYFTFGPPPGGRDEAIDGFGGR